MRLAHVATIVSAIASAVTVHGRSHASPSRVQARDSTTESCAYLSNQLISVTYWNGITTVMVNILVSKSHGDHSFHYRAVC